MHKNDNPDLPCSSPKLPLDCAYYLNITPLLDADILWLSTSTSDLYRKYLSANRQIKKSIKEYSLAYKDSNKASNN
jgi:tricorn protease-like protein